MRFLHRIKNVSKWNRLVDSAADSKPDEALDILLSMDTQNLGHLFLDYYMMKSYLHLKNSQADETKPSIAEALSKINASQGLQEFEAAYRRKYLECIMARLYGRTAELAVTYEGLDLKKVSGRTKSLFPLRHHPNWVE